MTVPSQYRSTYSIAYQGSVKIAGMFTAIVTYLKPQDSTKGCNHLMGKQDLVLCLFLNKYIFKFLYFRLSIYCILKDNQQTLMNDASEVMIINGC